MLSFANLGHGNLRSGPILAASIESINSLLRVRVSPFSPEIYLSSETKIELDLKLGAWRHHNLKFTVKPPVKRLSQICLVLLPFSINLKFGF